MGEYSIPSEELNGFLTHTVQKFCSKIDGYVKSSIGEDYLISPRNLKEKIAKINDVLGDKYNNSLQISLIKSINPESLKKKLEYKKLGDKGIANMIDLAFKYLNEK